MMNKFVRDWLETGFTEISGVKNEVRSKNSLVPILRNENGEDQTPKPLFLSFSDEDQLDPEFLPKYLSVLESNFRHADSIKLEEIEKDADRVEKKKSSSKVEKVSIDYDRKNIHLSRVMFNLFEKPDTAVSKNSEDYAKVLEKNQMYQSALEKHRMFPDSFEEQSTQTQVLKTIEQEIETDAIDHDSKSSLINNYVFKERYFESEMRSTPPPKTFKEYFETKTMFSDYKEFLSAMDNFPSVCKSVQETLYVMEKALDYNSFSDSILKFNGCRNDLCKMMTDSLDINKGQSITSCATGLSSNVTVKQHLTFHLNKMKNDYKVTCVEFNPHTPNMFAAGYGVSVDHEMDHKVRGMVLCWNINKCGYPEKIYKTREIVTCLEFSKTQQFLVAVGMRYGRIAIFQLQRLMPYASSDNKFSKSRPMGVIKSIRWFKKKFGMGEENDMLLSVSIEGSICCWTPGKNLDGYVLRTTKRGDMKQLIESGRRMALAVDASATCMEFQPGVDEMFLVGTVEGEVLLANVSDPDPYIQVFKCHNGPVLDLQWSPLVKGVFMTTGINKSIHMWEEGKMNPRKSLRLKEDVFKIVWSQTKSTLFAAMSRTKILIFDLTVNVHNEVAEYVPKSEAYFSCLNFCPINNWMLVGFSNGAVELLEISNIPDPEADQIEALRKTFIVDD